jgi:Asp-tRNA(Asn)/Glu-tRNA(Gln) amidotransferase C subunit
MEEKIWFDKETFLSMAKLLKVDEEDSHLEELYTYVEKLFASFKVAEGMDLAEIEPMLTLVLPKE